MKLQTVKQLQGHAPRKPRALRAKSTQKPPAPPLMLARQRALIDRLLARLEHEVEGEGKGEAAERHPFLWGSKASAVELLAQLVGLTAKLMEMERGVKEGGVAGDAVAAEPPLSNEEWEIVADYAKRREG